MILSTPGDVLFEMVQAAQKGPVPDGGLGMLIAIRERLRERGLLTTYMAASSIEALLEETVDEIAAAQEAELRHAEGMRTH